jgi:probable phosphoglycerate mutase
MRLYFVRHGESEANLAREFSNRGFKHPLTPKGIAQAQALATQLAGHNVTNIFSSPLQRAVQTADLLAQACGVSVAITAALREWDVGILEGTTDQHGWDMHRQIQEDWFVHHQLDHKIPEGESFLDMRARFAPFIHQLVQTATPPSAVVVLVGHGGLYHAMLPMILQNIDYELITRHPFANTAYAVAETRPGGLYCREWCGMAIEN